MKGPRVIVGGFLGLFPSGGIAWHYLQYPACFAELGCDVYYVEDTRLWPVFQAHDSDRMEPTENIQHLDKVMSGCGLQDRWAYRDEATGECYGMSATKVKEICRSADVFVNVSCANCMRDDYANIPIRILIDTDPMFTQVQCATDLMFTEGSRSMLELLRAHTHHFTFGMSIGTPECQIPQCGIRWQPTRQPIWLPAWKVSDRVADDQRSYSTVMNWNVAKPMVYDGESWGQKNVEFSKLISLPSQVPSVCLSVAVTQTGGDPFPRTQAEASGWQVLEAQQAVADWWQYQDFINQSRGEFSVAKETYVKAKTGWFSERSACYLASGRPVVAQDTGWTRHLPAGEGLLSFDDQASAAAALRQVESDWSMHSRRAREIAEAHFDGSVVLKTLLAEAGVG